MRTRRRPVTAAGAAAVSVLLLASTACSSASDESTGRSAGESLPDVAVGSTADTTASTDGAAPATNAPSDTTAAESAPADTGGGGAANTQAPVVVPEALRFTAPLVGGGTFDGAAVAGKPTVFWFWAPT